LITGAIRMCINLKKLAASLIILPLIASLFSSPAAAVEGLGNVSVVINDDTVGANSQASVRFSLPVNSAQVNTTDYIQVFFGDFTNVSAPSSMTGQFGGTPSFSVSGNYARVTGITVTPGAYVTIEGITATNPNLSTNFQVIVLITEDEDGLIVKNTGNAIATETAGTVSVSASIDTPQGRLRIEGYTAPGTFIVFTENDAIIGTDVASSNGFFSQVFPGMVVITHNITLYGVDLLNLVTSPIPLEIYTPTGQEITISDLILSPTLSLADTIVPQGDDLVASGTAIPNGAVTIFTDTPLRTYYATASATGYWNYTITNTAEYVPGDYRIYALVQDDLGAQSLNSNSIGFTIGSGTDPVGTACGDISRGDLNCDDIINLTDFSIMMYYWGSANLSSDINGDGTVNLTDFSIMMYWWGT
jgi:hypothetical protein